MPDSPELLRVTTDYVPEEDRLRLSGAVADDRIVVLWLTQRLLNRLVPQLTGGLEQHGGAMIDSELMQGFAQQAAEAALEPEPAVRAASSEAAWRVDTVDIVSGPGGARLTFKSHDGKQAASLTLPTEALRQWLGIVRRLYVAAEWPTAVWPAWMDEADAPAAMATGPIVH